MAASWNTVYGDAQNIAFGSSTYTSPSETWGAGYAVVWFWDDEGGAQTHTVTINGASATKLAEGTRMFCYAATVSAGTGTVVITTGGIFGTIATNGGYFSGANSASVVTAKNSSSNNPDPQSLTITVPTGGACAVGIGGETSSANPTTWSNATREATREASTAGGNTAGVAGANNSTAGSQTITAAGSGGGNGWGFFNDNMIAVAVGPASAGGGLRFNSNLDGLGASGPFFRDPLGAKPKSLIVNPRKLIRPSPRDIERLAA